MLEQFNHADHADGFAVLRPCLGIERWAAEILDARPYPTLDALLAVADTAAAPFADDELAAALAHHPRIGDRVAGTSAEAGLSRAEQAGVGLTGTTEQALKEGNRAYEAKFDRVFLIRAAGRSADDILAALNERLGNTPEEESIVIETQLREIAVNRLKGEIAA